MNSNGVVEGVYYTNLERNQQLNERISSRNIPSVPLQPIYSGRPVSTKYSKMSIIDQYKQATVPIAISPNFNIGTVFNPGNAEAPWSGYASNVDVETILRNQAFALQKGDRASYIPSSNSDLYNVEIHGRQEAQPFPGLFNVQTLEPFNPNTYNLGNDVFNNATRQQLKNLSDQ
jgi:hypothetical protein